MTGRTIPGRDSGNAVLGVGILICPEDGLKLISDIDGTGFSLTEELTSVNSVMEIQGDVGVSTGNLSFARKHCGKRKYLRWLRG